MECLICGKDYVALGVHIRHKHKVTLEDYKDAYGLMRTTPLVDGWLSERLSKYQKHRHATDTDYAAECAARCVAQGKSGIGKPGFGMSDAGKKSLAKRNSESNNAYLKRITPDVLRVYQVRKTIQETAKDVGTSPATARKILATNGIRHTMDERERRRLLAIKNKKEARMRDATD